MPTIGASIIKAEATGQRNSQTIARTLVDDHCCNMHPNGKTLKWALLLLAYLTYVKGGEWISYSDCGSKAKLIWIDVDPCDDAYNCTLKRGADTVLSIRFAPKETITKLNVVMQTKVRFEYKPFKMDNPDACKDSGLTCSLQPNKEVTYRKVFHIKQEYPKAIVHVRFQLVDQNGNDQICVYMPFHIDDVSHKWIDWGDERKRRMAAKREVRT
ncbi:hypothetical protein M514_09678 [Trichuris suis]|uniref:MD-2-related lipid-recognition domain-containing protein n=1 Tax=Trichuris suis TaxID=68888 RepID=A0A085LWR5_9BILA|nr:hypothetical protein M513_09678 [Trichuris suis]KFD63627.1 hypothetical protein M514_09678 [Trichuris suis]